MSSEMDWDEARRDAQKFEWMVIAVLVFITVVIFGGWKLYDDYKLAHETCAQRQERLSEAQGVPLLYDPRTGRPAGC